MREDQIANGVTFLTHPKVKEAPLEERLSFLRNKGLTEDEIKEAVKRSSEKGEGENDNSDVPNVNNEVGPPIPPLQAGMPGQVGVYPAAPPTIPRQSSSWARDYLVPGTLALSAGAGLAFLYKTMVLKQGMGGPQQWFGPYAPPPPVQQGPHVNHGFPAQQTQGESGVSDHTNSLPGAPGAKEALSALGKPIPSAERYAAANKDGDSSQTLVPLDQSTMFGKAPYGPSDPTTIIAGATGYTGQTQQSGQESGNLTEVVAKQSEILRDVGSALKTLTSELAEMKKSRDYNSGSASGDKAWLVTLSQSTSDMKSELNAIKTLLLAGHGGDQASSSVLKSKLLDIEEKLGEVDGEIKRENRDEVEDSANPLDNLIKAASMVNTEPATEDKEQTDLAENAQTKEEEEVDYEEISQNKMQASRTALAEMVSACPKDKLRAAVNLLLMYLRNLVKEPDVPRYGRIARTNQSYVKSLSTIEHHMDLLKSNGFEERQSGSASRSPTLEWSDEWRENKDNWALGVLQDTITNLESVAKSTMTCVESAAPRTESPVPQTTPQKEKFVAKPFSVPTQPVEPAPMQPVEPVPTQPVVPVPSQPVGPVPMQPVEPVPTQPVAPVPMQVPEPQSTARSGETSEGDRAPLSYGEVISYLQAGKEPPGIKKIPNELSVDAQNPTEPSMAPLPKPWEKHIETHNDSPLASRAVESFADILKGTQAAIPMTACDVSEAASAYNIAASSSTSGVSIEEIVE